MIIPEDEKYIPTILLQLNSKLFAYIHKKQTSGENKAFAQLPKHYIEKLPCKVNKLLLEKAQSLLEKIEINIIVENNISKLEREIDQLVYELYGLNEEEIAIIEGGCQS